MATETRWTLSRNTNGPPSFASRGREPFNVERSRAAHVFVRTADKVASDLDDANAFDVVREARHLHSSDSLVGRFAA